jgi:hypothetical protein
MAAVRKEVTGVAADLANTYDMNPQGGTSEGPATGKKYLKDAQGYYGNDASADTDAHGLSKGPQNGSLGATGTSMSGNGKGRF